MRMDILKKRANLHHLSCAVLVLMLVLIMLSAEAVSFSDGNIYSGAKYNPMSYADNQTVLQVNIDRTGDILLYFNVKLTDSDDYVGVSFFSESNQSGSLLHTIHFGNNPVVPKNNGVTVTTKFDKSSREVVLWYDSKNTSFFAFVDNTLMKTWDPTLGTAMSSVKSVELFTGLNTNASFAHAYAGYPLVSMIGDSIAVGVGAGGLGGNTIPKLLGNFLRVKGIRNYFVVNKAVRGDTTEQIKNRLTSDVLQGTGCAYLFIQGGINDSHANNISITIANKRNTADIASAAGVNSFIIGVMPTLIARRDFSISLHNAEKSAYPGYQYIDVWNALAGTNKDDSAATNMMADDLHPNASGLSAISNEIINYLSSEHKMEIASEPLEIEATVNGAHGLVMDNRVLFRKSPTNSDYWDYLNTGWVAKILSTTKSGGYTWYNVETNIPMSLNRTYKGYIRGDFFRLLTQEEEAAWLVNKLQPFTVEIYNIPTSPSIPPAQIPSDDIPNQMLDEGFPSGTLKIIKTSTNLRQEPGGTSIWKYPIGKSLTYYGLPIFSGGFYWTHVTDGQRKLSGYVRSDCYVITSVGKTTNPTDIFVTPMPSSTDASVRIILVRTNLRQTPGGSVLAMLNHNRILPFYGSPIPFGGYKWVYVYDDVSQQYGYLRSDCYELVSH